MAPDESRLTERLSVELGEDMTVRDLLVGRLRVELYSAIQHPDMALRQATWDLIDELQQIRPMHEPAQQSPG